MRTGERDLLGAKGKYVGALSMDISKAFDANDLYEHNLLIIKLEAYCFWNSFLTYLKSYLDKWQQRLNINNNFSCYNTVFKSALHSCTAFV